MQRISIGEFEADPGAKLSAARDGAAWFGIRPGVNAMG